LLKQLNKKNSKPFNFIIGLFLLPLFTLYGLIEAFYLVFFGPYKSFQYIAKQNKKGAFKSSYQQHLEFKHKTRVFSASTVVIIIISVFTVNVVTGALNLNNIFPVFADTSFTVDNLGDASDANAGDGNCATAGAVCTLRAAIEEHNALGGTNTIDFSVSGTINVNSYIRIDSDNLMIDGGSNHDVVINGSGAAIGDHDCLYINNSSDNTIKGLVIQNCRYGIRISTALATGNIIQNNYIGTNTAGTSSVSNGTGISISGNSNIIGTDGDGVNDSNEGNLISGNTSIGIGGGGIGNTIAGNIIGPNISGTAI